MKIKTFNAQYTETGKLKNKQVINGQKYVHFGRFSDPTSAIIRCNELKRLDRYPNNPRVKIIDVFVFKEVKRGKKPYLVLVIPDYLVKRGK